MSWARRHDRTVRWLINKFLPHESPIIGAEIGVYQGKLSLSLLQTFPNLHMHLVDIWKEVAPDSDYWKSNDAAAIKSGKQWQENKRQTLARTEAYKERRTVWHCDSIEAASSLKEKLDFIFIDAEHTKTGVARDISLWWPFMKKSGLFCGHDYDAPLFPGVKEAVDEFAESHSLKVSVGPGWVWWFRT